MGYVFDYINSQIDITSPQVAVDCQALYNVIAAEEATSRGICFPVIASASGKQTLSSGVLVGLTVNLISWQLLFYTGSYQATISGGNLVGGISSNPVAYVAGVQVVLLLSASATITSGSGGATASDIAIAVWNEPTASHTTSGTFGAYVGSKLLNIAKYMGLK